MAHFGVQVLRRYAENIAISILRTKFSQIICEFSLPTCISTINNDNLSFVCRLKLLYLPLEALLV